MTRTAADAQAEIDALTHKQPLTFNQRCTLDMLQAVDEPVTARDVAGYTLMPLSSATTALMALGRRGLAAQRGRGWVAVAREAGRG